jgi:5-hydroxyisourate hydrolase
VAHGRVAAGLRVRLRRLGSDGQPGASIASGETGANGLWAEPLLMGRDILAGGYEAGFSVGAFYRSQGIAVPDPAFLEDVVYRFYVTDATQHFHLPFKFTPWGFSLFRGGA